MGYKEIAVGNVIPVMDNLKNNNKISHKIFSMVVDDSGARHGGLIFWGGSNEQFYEPPLRYVDIQKQGFFNVTMDSVSIPRTGGSFCRGGCFAIVDSGTSLIGGPDKDIAPLNKMLGATPAEFGEFVLDCDTVKTLPDVHLTFGGQAFRVPAEKYVLKIPDIDGTDTCISGFMTIDIPGDNSPSWVIGDIFLSKFYVEYDMEKNRVGFANKKKTFS